MRLAPAASGRELLGDALPHALSLLQALAPGAEVRLSDIRFSTHAPDAKALTLDFRYHADAHTVAARVELTATDSQPREAAYAIDGWRARREVRMEDYALTLVDEDDGRSVPLPDPLGRLVGRFVRDLEHAVTGAPNVVEGVPASTASPGSPAREIWQRMACLEELARVLARALGLPLSSVVLERGHTGRNKRFRIEGLGEAEAERRLQAALPSAKSAEPEKPRWCATSSTLFRTPTIAPRCSCEDTKPNPASHPMKKPSTSVRSRASR